MSIQLRIAEPQEGASEVATKTRESLQQWIESVQDKCGDTPMEALSASSVADLVAEGGRLYHERGMLAAGQSILDGGSHERFRLYSALIYAMGGLEHVEDLHSGREVSYIFEGMVRGMNKAVHEAGVKLSGLEQRVLFSCLMGNIYNTGLCGAFTRKFVQAYIGSWAWEQYLRAANVPQILSGFAEQRAKLDTMFQEFDGTPFTHAGRNYSLDQQTTHSAVRAVVYMDVDGPWVAGLLSPMDMYRVRFSRKRLGAWMAESGVFSDEQVRSTVEAIKAQGTGGVFTVYPNDILFGDVYIKARKGGVRSCMANDANEYHTWDDIHPCDVYSTAYHGVGDNGLALFAAEDPTGNIVGRGIWSSKSNKVVRWYGDETKFRALRKLGMSTNSAALQDSYLALIGSGNKFIAPYIDGDIDHGDPSLSEGRVYLGDTGVYLSEASGVVGIETVYCINDECDHDRDDCTYQPETNSWVWDTENLGWSCPVIQEWQPESNREVIWLDGEQQEVCWRVVSRISSYLVEIPATDEMIQEYCTFDDDGNVEDDSELPTNYTANSHWFRT